MKQKNLLIFNLVFFINKLFVILFLSIVLSVSLPPLLLIYFPTKFIFLVFSSLVLSFSLFLHVSVYLSSLFFFLYISISRQIFFSANVSHFFLKLQLSLSFRFFSCQGLSVTGLFVFAFFYHGMSSTFIRLLDTKAEHFRIKVKKLWFKNETRNWTFVKVKKLNLCLIFWPHHRFVHLLK